MRVLYLDFILGVPPSLATQALQKGSRYPPLVIHSALPHASALQSRGLAGYRQRWLLSLTQEQIFLLFWTSDRSHATFFGSST